MRTTTKKIIKKMLVHFPIQYSERMDALFHLPLLSRWIEKYKPHPYFEARERLYKYLAETTIRNAPISFLEFGVYQGASMSDWTKLNTNVRSEFIGFDSFEGLPEAWINLGGTFEQGSFSTGGALPPMTDSRMSFVKGWFQDTLPLFLNRFSTDQQIVIHCDADLYSSTMFVLCKLDALVKPGVIVIFDDFSSMLHDYRALDDYTHSFCRTYEVLGAAGRFYYENVAIRFTK
jgi:O-methyltransferase